MFYRICLGVLAGASMTLAQQPTTQQPTKQQPTTQQPPTQQPNDNRKEPSNQRDITKGGETSQNSASVKSSTSGSSLSSADRKFLEKAAEGGRMEVALGRLASQRALDPQVKAFGEMMVRDHGQANKELESLAKEKGLTLPAEKEPSQLSKLSKMNGAEFDKAYVNDMVSDHKKDVAEFQKESRSASNPEVRSWAAKTLPTLQMHLDEIQKIQQQLGNKGSADRSQPQGRANTERNGAENKNNNEPTK